MAACFSYFSHFFQHRSNDIFSIFFMWCICPSQITWWYGFLQSFLNKWQKLVVTEYSWYVLYRLTENELHCEYDCGLIGRKSLFFELWSWLLLLEVSRQLFHMQVASMQNDLSPIFILDPWMSHSFSQYFCLVPSSLQNTLPFHSALQFITYLERYFFQFWRSSSKKNSRWRSTHEFEQEPY